MLLYPVGSRWVKRLGLVNGAGNQWWRCGIDVCGFILEHKMVEWSEKVEC